MSAHEFSNAYDPDTAYCRKCGAPEGVDDAGECFDERWVARPSVHHSGDTLTVAPGATVTFTFGDDIHRWRDELATLEDLSAAEGRTLLLRLREAFADGEIAETAWRTDP